VLVSVAVAVLIVAATPSGALATREGPRRASRLPTLLTGGMDGRFAVRPASILTGAGATVYDFVGAYPGKGGRIRWTAWTTRKAQGVGTLWINDCIPSTADGTWRGHRATVSASRVRNRHFTRLTVRFRDDAEAKTWKGVLRRAEWAGERISIWTWTGRD